MENSQKELHFSPGFTGIKKFSYIAIRIIYIILTSSALPLALIYVKKERAFIDLPVVLAWIAGVGAMIWSLIYISLEQFSYPKKMFASIIITGGLILNAWTGASLGSFNIYYGSYSVVIAAALAQFIFLGFITSISFLPALRKKFLDDIPSWYSYFLLGIFVSLGVLLFYLKNPILDELTLEGELWKRIIYGIAFIWQVVSDILTLKEGSILGNSAENKDESTWNLYEAYTPLIAIEIIITMLSCLIIAVW
jgi:hypothetical protein